MLTTARPLTELKRPCLNHRYVCHLRIKKKFKPHFALFPFSVFTWAVKYLYALDIYVVHCGRFFPLYLHHYFWFLVMTETTSSKKMSRCCKTLGRIATDGQLGIGRGRWLQLLLKHLPQVSKPALLPSMQRNVVNIFFLDWSFKKSYNCVCVFLFVSLGH